MVRGAAAGFAAVVSAGGVAVETLLGFIVEPAGCAKAALLSHRNNAAINQALCLENVLFLDMVTVLSLLLFQKGTSLTRALDGRTCFRPLAAALSLELARQTPRFVCVPSCPL